MASPFSGDVSLLTRFCFPSRDAARTVEAALHNGSKEFQAPAKIGIQNGHTEWYALPETELNDVIFCAHLAEKCYRLHFCNEAKDWLSGTISALSEQGILSLLKMRLEAAPEAEATDHGFSL